MKKLFKRLKESKVIKVVIQTVIGAAEAPLKPIAGAVIGLKEGIKQVKSDNLNSELGGQGKVNLPRLIGSIGIVALLGFFLFDKVSIEKFNLILEVLLDLVSE